MIPSVYKSSLGYVPYVRREARVPAKDRVQIIQKIFVSIDYIHENQVNVIEDNTTKEEKSNLMYYCEVALTNWEAIEIPEITPLSK